MYRDRWMKLLAKKVHIQGMIVLLADKMHKQEAQCKWLHSVCTQCIVIIRSRAKKLKRFLKRNLPNVGTVGCMGALADKVHKQGEHIPQHRYISHNHS